MPSASSRPVHRGCSQAVPTTCTRLRSSARGHGPPAARGGSPVPAGSSRAGAAALGTGAARGGCWPRPFPRTASPPHKTQDEASFVGRSRPRAGPLWPLLSVSPSRPPSDLCWPLGTGKGRSEVGGGRSGRGLEAEPLPPALGLWTLALGCSKPAGGLSAGPSPWQGRTGWAASGATSGWVGSVGSALAGSGGRGSLLAWTWQGTETPSARLAGSRL